MNVGARANVSKPGLAFLRRHWGFGLIVLVTSPVAVSLAISPGTVIRSDGWGYHAWTYAILRGDLNFEGLSNHTYAFHENRPGFWSNSYPPGVAIARFPVMAFLVGSGEQFGRPTAAENWAVQILSALALLATALLLNYACRTAGAADGPTNAAILA